MRAPDRGRRVTVAVAAAMVTALLGGGAVAGGAPPTPRGQLRAAASGTWSGPFGAAEFRADDTATLSVLSCGYEPVRPGKVRTFTDCPPDSIEGAVRVQPGGYAVTGADGTTRELAAYVDGDDRLHLGFGVVTRLAPDRTGTVVLAPEERLVVRRDGCRYKGATFELPIATRCRFERTGGRQVLVFEILGGADPTGDLVYLPGPRLLVSPELVDRVYERA